MLEPRPYQYKTPSKRTRRTNVGRLKPKTTLIDAVPLTGFINGLIAKSEIEERYARGLRNAGRKFQYEWRIFTAFTLPNQSRQIDFLVDEGGIASPKEVYGPLHLLPQAKVEDERRVAELDAALRKIGIERPIEVIWFYELTSQDLANKRAING